MATELRFDTFYHHAELTDILRGFAGNLPSLCSIVSIGKSYEGRDIWLAILTNSATGSDADKPAFWVDANIHATELAPSTCALYTIHKILTGYGRDPQITRLLDTRALYVVPRANPDGAELYLREGRRIRSSTRPYPREEAQDGLYSADVDGDGRRLMMRIKDPNGPWRVHPADARLLVARDPDDASDTGPHYRVLPEGLIRGYDGATIKLAPNLEGLDLNRNFPLDWVVESEQTGAGPYPTSEPEVRAMVQYIVEHPNICGGITFHTHSGVYLRPYGTRSDESFPAGDLWTFQEIGRHATRITGYPTVSVFHDFRYHPKETIKGVFDDWMYDHIGVHAWTCELWSPQQRCGIDMKSPRGGYRFTEWWRTHDVADDLALLKWNDEELDGKGFVAWAPFEHPQLGVVDIGGWDIDYAWRNPPPHLLEREIAPHADFVIWHALISPRIELREVAVELVSDGASQPGVYKIRAVVQNTGWLPTSVTDRAVEKKLVRPLEIELRLPDGAELISGERMVELGQLAGRNGKLNLWIWNSDPTTDRAKAEWIVRAPAGAAVDITARHARAGRVSARLVL